MGYSWTMTEYVIRIKKEKFAGLREAILLAGKANLVDRVVTHADTPEISDKSVIIELFNDYGFSPSFEVKTGDLIEIEQMGDKLSDEEHLMSLIAPYCTTGDSIDGRGEDGYLWRWVLDPERGMYNQVGMVFFDMPSCPMKEAVELCTACPFALVCNTSGDTVLKSAQCSHCGGTIVYKNSGNITGAVAGITCKCLTRKFDVKKFKKKDGGDQ